MSVIDRASLEQSPLADLHAIASELSIDSYRRLRKAELVDAILRRQEGEEGGAAEGGEPDESPRETSASTRRRRSRRGGRARSATAEREDDESAVDGEPARGPDRSERSEPEEPDDEIVEGVVELLPGGAAFVRIEPPEPSDRDVYVSAAQVRRCELVSGDRVSGPRRPPRRSERFASLVRVDTINGQSASEVADSTRFEDLPVAFPNQPFGFESDDPTVKLIGEQRAIGRGSRVTIVGERQAGKSETLRRLAISLAGQEGLNLWLVLTGVRPEEIAEWNAGPVEPAAAVSIAGSPDAQAQALEGVIEQARRLAARGADAVVLIDTLEWLTPHAARRALAAARNLVDGGSLTVIATAAAAQGGETAVIALDSVLATSGKFPAVDLEASWTMRAEQLRGETA